MKTILVLTDFSPAGTNAAKYGADMAQAIGARLTLLHICKSPMSYSEIPVLLDTDQLMEDAEKAIEALKKQLEQSTGAVSIGYKVQMGPFFTELQSACEQLHPFAVVMGSQGKTAAERLFFGGHTIQTLQHLPWPVIAVPKDVSWSSIKKIGLACDFGEVDATPVQEIRDLVETFHADLFVLNTGEKAQFNPDIVFESTHLQNMLARLHPQYHFLTGKSTEQSIMAFAENNGINLLIVLPKRHGLAHLFHKSHTRQLVLHCHVPVMALHTTIHA